jgi:hypothetical protein
MLKKITLIFDARNNVSISRQLDNLGLTLIGLVSLGYCLLTDKFAEISIQLPFFDFPIFIGEICLFLCLFFFLLNWIITKRKITWLTLSVLAYILFILFRAVSGYLEWGPLALRHSAMFYYPLFAVIGFYSFRKEFFKETRTGFLIALFIFILAGDGKFLHIAEWGRITCFILAFILIKQLPVVKIRYLLFLALFICAPYKLFFLGSRAMLVSNLAVAIFLLITLPLAVKVRKNVLLGFTILTLIFLYFGLIKFSDRNALRSISSFKDNIRIYKKYLSDIRMLEPFFTEQSIKKMRVYNKAGTVVYGSENVDPPEKALQAQIEQRLSKLEDEQAKIDQNFGEQISKFKELDNAMSPKVAARREPASSGVNSQTAIITNTVTPGAETKQGLRAAEPLGTATIKKDAPKVTDIQESPSARESAVQVKPRLPETVLSREGSRENLTPEYAELTLEKRRAEANITGLLVRKKEIKQQQVAFKQQLQQLKTGESLGQYPLRDLNSAYGNSIFRIFIWQDMLTELITKKQVFGFSFGKPFRSRKIEILNIADGEWKRDGWIAAHNSYLEIIYRTGILGILFIILIFYTFTGMVLRSIEHQSVTGILLCGVVLNLLVAANFMLILELPYYAIPLWSLFGLTLAYLRELSIQN